VFEAKIGLLATLLQNSQRCIAYTGAGISTSSGIADYASVSAGSKSHVASLVVPKTKEISWLDMQPSMAHFCITELYHAGKWALEHGFASIGSLNVCFPLQVS
jgi:hypothetical protein